MRKLFFPFILLINLLACQNKPADHLTIAAAANVQFVMEELVEQFTKNTGIDCEIIHSSSGKLTAQIKQGAPYDIFISADMKYPEELYHAGLTTSPPQIYAFGKLVAWTMMDELPLNEIVMADDNLVKHVAIANPKTAPYGAAAIEALKRVDQYEAIQLKLVFGESISQVNQFVMSKTAELGITAKSVVLSPKMKDQGEWREIPSESYSPINQGVVVLKTGQVEKAEAFYAFLFSPTAKTILEQFGYGVP